MGKKKDGKKRIAYTNDAAKRVIEGDDQPTLMDAVLRMKILPEHQDRLVPLVSRVQELSEEATALLENDETTVEQLREHFRKASAVGFELDALYREAVVPKMLEVEKDDLRMFLTNQLEFMQSIAMSMVQMCDHEDVEGAELTPTEPATN